MKTGEYIKFMRTGGNPYEKKWSQEELGELLNPPVKRAAINKWESGTVEHIKKSYIEQLAKIFGVTPCDLMCFESVHDEEQISEEVKVIEAVQNMFGKGAVQILHHFYNLNDLGKEKALEDLSDLNMIPKYTEK